jgi:hypothetical protein
MNDVNHCLLNLEDQAYPEWKNGIDIDLINAIGHSMSKIIRYSRKESSAWNSP